MGSNEKDEEGRKKRRKVNVEEETERAKKSVRERLALQPEAESDRPKYKRKKSKKHLPRSISDELMENEPKRGGGQMNLTSRTAGRKLPVKRFTEDDSYHGDGEISDALPFDKNDIIDTKDTSNAVVGPNAQPSQPREAVYIEKKDCRGFIKGEKWHVNRSPAQLIDEEKEYTMLDMVLKLHLVYRSFANLSHGLLAGIAACQCVFVYTLAARSDEALLENYHRLALPFQAIYYFLLAVCTLSVLDRYVNIGNGWHHFCMTILSNPSRAVGIAAYFFSLVFSVCLAQLDDRVGLYKLLPSLWETTDNRLATWKAINLVRVIGSVLGWVVVCINHLDDQTARSIRESIENESVELNTLPV